MQGSGKIRFRLHALCLAVDSCAGGETRARARNRLSCLQGKESKSAPYLQGLFEPYTTGRRFIQDRPEPAKVLNRLSEILKAHRLYHASLLSEVVALFQVKFLLLA